jgi:hypothetical protein
MNGREKKEKKTWQTGRTTFFFLFFSLSLIITAIVKRAKKGRRNYDEHGSKCA